MAISKTRGAFSAWTAVAMGGVGESAEIDVSLHRTTRVHLQGFLDTGAATAHTGTQFIIQGNSALTGDENWGDLLWWTELVGTCNPEALNSASDPLVAGATGLVVASNTGYVVADVPLPWIAIDDATLTNSELAQLTTVATLLLTIQDPTVRDHAKTTTILGNVAFSKMSAPLNTNDLTRLRVVVNNNFDSNGAVINWRFCWTANLK